MENFALDVAIKMKACGVGAELFGEGRLRRILEESGSLGSEELKEKILEEVRRFVGEARHTTT